MKPIVIFGAGDIAEIAHFYFSNDSAGKVAAFTVDGAYLKENKFCDLPVIPFEELERSYPSQENDMFVAVSYTRLNQVRAEKCAEAKMKGYRLANYLSTKATVWQGFTLQENCFILEDNTIQPFAKVGNNVTLWSGNHIGHHSQIGDNCFIASHVVVSGGVTVGENCFIGVNATIRDHVAIGANSVIGAGVLVLQDIAENGVYMATATERSKVPSHRLRKI